MKKILFILLILPLILQSCNSNEVYRNYEEFENQQWAKTSESTFTVEIEDKTLNYDLGLSLRYNTGVKHKTFKAKITMTDPSGESTEKDVVMERYDSEGVPAGEEAGGYGDLDTIFAKDVILQKGKYVFKVSQNMEPEVVGGIMKVGVFANKVESK